MAVCFALVTDHFRIKRMLEAVGGITLILLLQSMHVFE
jgi:hypothetical protein